MLSQKLLIDVDIGMFAGENRYQQRKSAAKSARIASFHRRHPGYHLGASSS